LKTPTLDLEDLYGLMEEAQDVFGILFDDFPPTEVTVEERIRDSGFEIGGGENDLWSTASCIVDLDAAGTATLPSASSRALAFTLWLKAADFRARAAEAVERVRQVLADNPHTTLQVVLEPTGEPRHLTAEVLEALLAASHESLSYLDWFYSLHPIRLLGAKRLVVLLPKAEEEFFDDAWLDDIEDRATIHWSGNR